MPSTNFRRNFLHLNPRRWRLNRRKAIKLLIPLLMIVIGCIIIIVRVSPMILELSMANVSDMMRGIIGESVNEVLATGAYDYTELITIEKDENGNVAALVTNMMRINMLQTEVADTVLANIDKLEDVVISIPVGSLTGMSLLSGAGPKIKVKLLSITSVDTAFSNEFTSAGINQTRHQILMNVAVDVGVVLPTETPKETVSMDVVIAETVVVGTVPSTYTDFK